MKKKHKVKVDYIYEFFYEVQLITKVHPKEIRFTHQYYPASDWDYPHMFGDAYAFYTDIFLI